MVIHCSPVCISTSTVRPNEALKNTSAFYLMRSRQHASRFSVSRGHTLRTHMAASYSRCGRSEKQRHTAHVLGQKRDFLLMSSATCTPSSRHAPLNTSAVASHVHGPVPAPMIILLPNGTHSLVFPGQYVCLIDSIGLKGTFAEWQRPSVPHQVLRQHHPRLISHPS